MHYLGTISGTGMVVCDGKDMARASYDFEGFQRPSLEVVGSGEIRFAARALKDVFGRHDVQIRTDDGRLLDLRFSEKKLDVAADSAHVDVRGELPSAQTWRR